MRRLLLPAATSLALLAGIIGPASATPPAGTARSIPAASSALPTSGTQFGAYVEVDPHTGTDRRSAVTHFESLIQRKIAIERVYRTWNESFPTADDLWSRNQGHTLYVSWGLGRHNAFGITWADVAAGRQDARIDAWAAGIRRFGAPMYFSFHHEPELSQANSGTPTDYIAAYRYVHDRFVADGVTNVTYGLTLVALTAAKGNAGMWYPGGAYVDVVAADGANWFGCTGISTATWRSFRTIFEPFYQWALSVNKPMVVAEYASSEDPANPGRKAAWFGSAAKVLRTWPQVRAVSYLQVAGGHGCPPRFVDSSRRSLRAFRAMGADPHLSG